MSARVLALCAACIGCHTGASSPVDATAQGDAPPDASAACTARLSGDFAETATAPACTTIAIDGSGDTLLELAIPSATLAPGIAASFHLGAFPVPGTYSSDSVPVWSARGLEIVGTGACVFNAGATAVPQGNFELALGAIDAGSAHGSLSLTLYVLAYPGTACGSADTEQALVTF